MIQAVNAKAHVKTYGALQNVKRERSGAKVVRKQGNIVKRHVEFVNHNQNVMAFENSKS